MRQLVYAIELFSGRVRYMIYLKCLWGQYEATARSESQSGSDSKVTFNMYIHSRTNSVQDLHSRTKKFRIQSDSKISGTAMAGSMPVPGIHTEATV